jgi:DNA-directed RNA polymerase specialized sigma24 family protein
VLLAEPTRFIADPNRQHADDRTPLGDARGSVARVGDRVAGARAAADLLRQDERLRKKIVVYAYRLTKNLADAKDLAHEAMSKAVDPEASPWDPEKQPKLLDHIGSIVNSLVANRRRGDGRHPSEAFDPDMHRLRDPQPTQLDALLAAEGVARYRIWMDLLRERLRGDRIALGKIDLMYEGVDDAGQQADRLNCTVDDIYAANRRITYHAELVKREAPEGKSPSSQPRPEADA